MNADLWTRFRTLLPLKLTLLVVLAAVVCVPYFGTQRFVVFPVTFMPQSPLDHWVPFTTGASWAYLSLYPLLILPPALMVQRGWLTRFAIGFTILVGVSGLVFFFWPTAVPRPPLPDDADWAYRLIVALDTPLNACPSLHASLAVFTALCAGGGALLARLFLWAWVGLIGYATLATKQHVVLDLVAGAALAVAVFFLQAWRQQSS